MRDKIANNIFQGFYRSYPFPKDWGRESRQCCNIADKILTLIREEGYVKLADDQKLPEQPTWCSLDGVAIRGATSVYTIAQRDMLKEGFRKVEIWKSP